MISCRCHNLIDYWLNIKCFYPMKSFSFKTTHKSISFFFNNINFPLNNWFIFLQTTMASKTSSNSLRSLFIQRLGSALFYGICSGLITVVNKLVLTSYGYAIYSLNIFWIISYYRFPSFQLLAIGQVNNFLCKFILTIFLFYLVNRLNYCIISSSFNEYYSFS